MNEVFRDRIRWTQFIALMLIVHFAHTSLFAQMRWMYRPAASSLTIEYVAPSFANSMLGGFSGSTLSLSGRFAVSEGWYIVAEVPYTSSAIKIGFFESANQSEARIGNPYAGVEVGGKESPVFGEIGFRPSVVDDNSFAYTSGLLGDIDRWEMYVPRATFVQGMLNLATVDETGFAGRLRVGPSVWIPHQGEERTIVHIIIGAGVGYRNESVGFGIQYTGRMRTTEKDWDGNKDSFSHLAASISGTFGSVRPELYYKIPLDNEQKEVVKNLIGASLSVELR